MSASTDYKDYLSRHGGIRHPDTDEVLALCRQAELSNRLFDGGWQAAQDGEPYTAEWCAPAVDINGASYMVYWQWREYKGGELEDASGYDWSGSLDRVEPQ